jgi:hypothetical protein
MATRVLEVLGLASLLHQPAGVEVRGSGLAFIEGKMFART